MITEIKMPPRDEVQIPHDVPRRSRKSRFLISSAALLVVLGIGWFAGAKTQVLRAFSSEAVAHCGRHAGRP